MEDYRHLPLRETLNLQSVRMWGLRPRRSSATKFPQCFRRLPTCLRSMCCLRNAIRGGEIARLAWRLQRYEYDNFRIRTQRHAREPQERAKKCCPKPTIVLQPVRIRRHAKGAFLVVWLQKFADGEQPSAKNIKSGSVSHDLFRCGTDATDTGLHFFLADEYHRKEGVSFSDIDE